MIAVGVVLVGCSTAMIVAALARGGRYPSQARVGLWLISMDTVCSAAITLAVFGLLAGAQAFARVIHWWAWVATLGPVLLVGVAARIRSHRFGEVTPDPLPKWRQI